MYKCVICRVVYGKLRLNKRTKTFYYLSRYNHIFLKFLLEYLKIKNKNKLFKTILF